MSDSRQCRSQQASQASESKLLLPIVSRTLPISESNPPHTRIVGDQLVRHDDVESILSISGVSTACTTSPYQGDMLAAQVSASKLLLPIPSRSLFGDPCQDMSRIDVCHACDCCGEVESVMSDVSTACTPLHLEHDIEGNIYSAGAMEAWHPERFEVVRTLQEAARNFGHVDLMRSINDGGSFVAVKRMPNIWMTSGHAEFTRLHPDETECPWVDVGILTYLSKKDYPYVCTLQGIFQSKHETFVVSSYASEGDLFSWTQQACRPGAVRESLMQPIAKQICAAVRWLHELDITHGDLSLENIMLTCEDDGSLQVKLIDFGMATFSQRSCQEPRGKPLYQAPEMHRDCEYDPVLADAFAVGVVLFTMASGEQPWTSTNSGACCQFDYVLAYGFRHYIARSLSIGNHDRLAEIFSEPLVEVLEGLLAVHPEHRLTLGEDCWDEDLMRASVWDLAWLRH